jgi:hypothetical protein
MTQAEEVEVPSRNIDELKRLVISVLDRNGVLSDLRSKVKLHVTNAINEDPHAPIVHQRNPRIASLMATERGQLLTELMVDLLRFYDLKDTLSMLLVEANLPRLRPSEAELASQCGFVHSPTLDLCVLEQYLARHPNEVHYAPQGEAPQTQFDVHAEPDIDSSPLLVREAALISDSPLFVSNRDDFSPPIATRDVLSGLDEPGDTSPVGIDTSMEKDMISLRNISRDMERISLTSLAPMRMEDSPRYENDEFDSDEDVSPTRPEQNRSRMRDNDPDAVLFESRESPLRDLGEASASLFPMDRNDIVEKVSI